MLLNLLADRVADSWFRNGHEKTYLFAYDGNLTLSNVHFENNTATEALIEVGSWTAVSMIDYSLSGNSDDTVLLDHHSLLVHNHASAGGLTRNGASQASGVLVLGDASTNARMFLQRSDPVYTRLREVRLHTPTCSAGRAPR